MFHHDLFICVYILLIFSPWPLWSPPSPPAGSSFILPPPHTHVGTHSHTAHSHTHMHTHSHAHRHTHEHTHGQTIYTYTPSTHPHTPQWLLLLTGYKIWGQSTSSQIFPMKNVKINLVGCKSPDFPMVPWVWLQKGSVHRSCRDSPSGKGTHCSSESRLSSQHPHSVSQPTITPVPTYVGTHGMHTYAGKTLIHKWV